jgi:hypothetical protein
VSLKLTTAVAVAALILTPALEGAASEDAAPRTSYRSLCWTSSITGESLPGLYLVELSSSGMVSWVLAETPGGAHLVLTSSVDPRQGITTTEITDGRGSWAASLASNSGLKRSTLTEYFAAADQLAAGDPVVLRLVLPDDISLETRVGVDYPSVMYAAFVRELVSMGLVERVAAAIPEEFKDGLLFLDRSLCPSPLPTGEGADNIAHGLRGPIEILASVLRRAEPGREHDSADAWSLEVGTAKNGVPMDSPEFPGLMEKFPALGRIQPLSD